MTRALALLALLACSGCAASNVGGGERAAASPAREQARRGGAVAPLAASPAAAPADTLTFTLPRFGSLSCAPDTAITLHERQQWTLWKLNTVTPPGYFHGCEDDSTCWAEVVRFNVPVAVDSGSGMPGERVSVAVGAGQYVATSRNSKGEPRCGWRVVVVP